MYLWSWQCPVKRVIAPVCVRYALIFVLGTCRISTLEPVFTRIEASHCFWGVSKQLVGASARFARLAWASTNRICITLWSNGWNVLSHYLAPLCMANGVLQRKEWQPLLLMCFKTLSWVHWPGLQGFLGHPPTLYASLYDQMNGIYIGSLFNQSKSQSQSQLSGPLSSWQIVYCNVRIDSHCSWGVSRHFMGVLARFARLPWESTNLICITLCPNVRNVLAHYLASAWVRSSQVGPYPHGKWCVAT